MSNFNVGQKVVCIKDGAWDPPGPENEPVKGQVLTISGMLPDDVFGLLLQFEEIDNSHIAGTDVWFDACRFRPVKTTNIEIFRAMLVNPPREIVGA